MWYAPFTKCNILHCPEQKREKVEDGYEYAIILRIAWLVDKTHKLQPSQRVKLTSCVIFSYLQPIITYRTHKRFHFTQCRQTLQQGHGFGKV